MRDRIELGRAIRDAREARGMTQLELSAKVSLSRPAIANIEAGRQAMPVDNLCAIARALDVTAGYLLGEHQDAGQLSVTLLTDLGKQQISISETLHEAAQLVMTLAKESESMATTLASLATGSKPEATS